MSALWSELAASLRLDLLVSLLMAIVLGGAIGLEREVKQKAAGLRTNVLICVGAALFTQLSVILAGVSGDPTRIAAQIVTGVGFIGAGTILHSHGSISGLTSAATIWLVAAIGVAAGAGALLEATGATLLVILVLAVLGRLEQHLTAYRLAVHVVIEVEPGSSGVADVSRIVRQAGLEVDSLRAERTGERWTVDARLRGPRRLYERAGARLLETAGVVAVSVEE